MSTAIAPADEAGIIDAVQAARAAREPLAIAGQGSKRGLLRPVQAARSLWSKLTSLEMAAQYWSEESGRWQMKTERKSGG